MQSMTGYGRSQQQLNGWDITVEIKSVNHRYFEFSCRTPRNCAFLEDKLKAQVQSRISRGKVDCYCAIVSTDAGDSAVLVNRALAKSYLAAMRELAEETGVPFEVTLRDLARLPDVFTVERAVPDEEALTAAENTCQPQEDTEDTQQPQGDGEDAQQPQEDGENACQSDEDGITGTAE